MVSSPNCIPCLTALCELLKGPDREKRFSVLSKLVELQPNIPQHFFDKATIQWEKGNLEDAVETMTQCIKFNDTFADAYSFRADLYRKLNQPEKAESDVNKYYELTGHKRK